MTSPPGPLAGVVRQRSHRLHALLARPVLSTRHRDAALALLNDPSWRPVPRIAATHAVHPLVVHHAELLGFREEHLYHARSELALSPTSRERLVLNDYGRRSRLLQTIEDLRAAGIDRLLLQKGASLSVRWPSPALREMEDLDVVVDPSDLPVATRLLAETGWRRRGFSWAYPDGVALDLSVPRGAFAREAMDTSVPHEMYHGARRPTTACEILVAAQHCARHAGARIWKELADLHFLTSNGEDVEVVREALALAHRHRLGALLGGMLLVANAIDREAPAYQWVRGLPTADRPGAGQLATLYGRMMAERISEFHLHAMLSATNPSALARRLLRRPVGRTAALGASLPAAQRDPLAGEVDRSGRLVRQWHKLRALWWMWRSGRMEHYRSLSRLASIGVAHPKPFDEKR